MWKFGISSMPQFWRENITYISVSVPSSCRQRWCTRLLRCYMPCRILVQSTDWHLHGRQLGRQLQWSVSDLVFPSPKPTTWTHANTSPSLYTNADNVLLITDAPTSLALLTTSAIRTRDTVCRWGIRAIVVPPSHALLDPLATLRRDYAGW